jgi:predicted transport protein
MEIKTTQEITKEFTDALVEYEQSKNHITIDNKMLRDKFNIKWVKVDDIESYFIRLANMGHSPKMSIQIFLKEISDENEM